MFQVYRKTIDRQFQRIEIVPLVFGPDTLIVPAGGSVKFVLKVEPWTDEKNKT